MLRKGKVIGMEKKHLLVCFDRLEACEKCGACEGGRKQTLVRVLGEAPVGSVVDVELPDNRILALSVIMYVIPLAGLLLGLFLGMHFFNSETRALLTGLAGLALFFLVVKAVDGKLQMMPAWQPHIVHEEQSREN